ncbi:restless-like transposase [Apiospora phragmitis]|uniref:Restless-like transposase n=1 Tax=Apiospora phragmitis TaxID=2905665 RepID=A0ABR1VT13_9PEZI
MPNYRFADTVEPPTWTEQQLHAFIKRCGPWLPPDTPGCRTAWVWRFGLDFIKDKKRCWICKICATKQPPTSVSFIHQNTSNPMNHLYTKHNIKAPLGSVTKSRNELSDRTKSSQRRDLTSFLTNLNANNADDVRIIHKIHSSFDKAYFQRLIVEWIVDESLPFRSVDSPGFHAVCNYLNPQVQAQQAIMSRTTLRSRVIQEFKRHHQTVITVLQNAPGQIHFAFDGWRSGNRHNVYGLTCFFRDKLTNQPRKIVLGMPEVSGSHTGDLVGAAIIKLIDSYNIGNKVGYFTLDNASNMDTAMDFIGNAYRFDGRRRRGRCFGHILNLAAKALLDPKGSTTDDIRTFDDSDDIDILTNAKYEEWRQQGPVGKLRILMIAIDQSDRLNDIFLTVQKNDYADSNNPADHRKKPMQLVKDNQTRWLGTYHMIKRGIKLRQYIEITRVRFYQQWADENRSPVTGEIRQHASSNIPVFLQECNELSSADWSALSRIAVILKDFEDCLIQLEGDGQIRHRSGGFEGSYGHIYHYLSGFEFILQKLEKYKEESRLYPDPREYAIGINAAWSKINDYYALLHHTPIYYAAHVFHPGQRWRTLEYLWPAHPEWIHDAKDQIRGIWNKEYRDLDITNPRPNTPAIHQPILCVNSFTSFLQQQREQATERRPSNDDRDNEYLH